MKRKNIQHVASRFYAHSAFYLSAAFAVILFCGRIEAQDASDAKAATETLLSFEGHRPGLCVHIGGTDGVLSAELAAAGNYHVQALTSNRANVEQMRQSAATKGLYGQVVVDYSPLKNLPYPGNLINVLVVEDFAALQKNGLTLKEIMRVVAPYSSAMLRHAPADVNELVTQAGYKDAVINQKGVWTQIIKPWPEGMGDWPQDGHDASGSSTSNDQLMQPPNSVQWIAGDLWRHELSPNSLISTGGRIFSSYPDLGIVARDAFNGMKLWQRKEARSAWIADEDRVYTRLEDLGPLVALDARTGRTLKTYSFGGAEKPWPPLERITYRDGVFLSGTAEEIEAYDATSGEELWRKRINERRVGGSKPFAQTVAQRRIIADGKVFLTLPTAQEFLCLDLKTGEELWRVPAQGDRFVTYRQGHLISGGKEKGPNVFNAAYSPEDGSFLWRYDYKSVWHGGDPHKIFLLNDLVWVLVSKPSENVKYSREEQAWHGLNPKTGEVVRRFDWPRTKMYCYGDVATDRYIIAGGMHILDSETGESHNFLGGKGSCTFGRLPANGLLYQTPNVCQCYSQVRGFAAFGSDAFDLDQRNELQNTNLLNTGTGKPADETPAPEDWPMLRRDPARSGSTTVALPSGLKPVWEKKIGGQLSSPVSASGKVFVSSIEDHGVMALDIKTGEKLWEYRANGRVDSPPTLYAGRAIFGDRDGWVHCVSSATGELIWSLQAAPQQRWLVSQGQMESAWPVYGSVMVDNDTVYFAAGRNSHVDGGVFLYAASPDTGEILWQQRYDVNSLKPVYMIRGTVTNDILVSDGKFLYMQSLGFDAATGSQLGGNSPFQSGYAGGFLSDIVKPMGGWHDHSYRPWRHRDSKTSGLSLAFSGSNIFGLRTTAAVERKPWIANGYETFSRSIKEEVKGAELWRAAVPQEAVPKAILSAGDKVYVAAVNGDDGSSKGTLLIYDAKDGRELSTIPLNVAPKFDGMAAVNGYLIVVGEDGEVVCLGKD